MARLLFAITLTVCCLPLLPGVGGLLASAFAFLPTLGLTEANFSGWHQVMAWPGLWQSIQLTLISGMGSSLLAVAFSFMILQAAWHTPIWQKISARLPALLALPHVAFAIGLVLLLSPSGWLFRLLSPLLGEKPVTWALVQDPYVIGLTLALTLKETPFLLLMSLSVLRQIDVSRLTMVSTSLGYNRTATWLKVILPLWLAKMRFPIFAVIAYSLSVVDVAMILGPNTPPTYAVLVWQWFNDPDLALLPRASAGALLLFALCGLALLLFRFLAWLGCQCLNRWQYTGRRHAWLPGKLLWWPVFITPLAIMPVLLVWSFALRWSFPDWLPSRYSLRFWEQELSYVWSLVGNSIVLAVISASVALLFAIGCLERSTNQRRSVPRAVIAIPLLVPQLSILFGIQVAVYSLPGQWHVPATIWSHIFFAFPYVYLALDGPWQQFDMRLMQTARSLGVSATLAWWRVKLPLLLPAIILAWAVGASVSLAQYLPTQLLGAGRINTLTTEAVSLSSGLDRRISGLYGLMQAMLPLIVFALATVLSRIAERRLLPTSTPTYSGAKHHDTVCQSTHHKRA
ncbi:ABC transporter permease [Salinivibrio kushneri]|uniref:ABC transporter permease n=1 Tax=Salinivibrio kushneri TaxID=1908198 RepID=UPI0009870CD7|nr:thiamine ABC transporter permease [Salinivibrio kushneri]OOE47091.1 thiamine ABC transporter permease [Salinivibrio kushneri]OOE51373.1 thiamine ABC transporter permease [Salinivibrio kushneri]OOE61229.1 thiamine ABC transporter permease [Salinivibrio kushneri]